MNSWNDKSSWDKIKPRDGIWRIYFLSFFFFLEDFHLASLQAQRRLDSYPEKHQQKQQPGNESQRRPSTTSWQPLQQQDSCPGRKPHKMQVGRNPIKLNLEWRRCTHMLPGSMHTVSRMHATTSLLMRCTLSYFHAGLLSPTLEKPEISLECFTFSFLAAPSSVLLNKTVVTSLALICSFTVINSLVISWNYFLWEKEFGPQVLARFWNDFPFPAKNNYLLQPESTAPPKNISSDGD